MLSASYAGPPSYSRTPLAHEYYGGTSSHILPRHTYPSACGINYEDESSTHYALPMASYLLPTTDANAMSGCYGSPGSTRSWNPLAQVDRNQQGTMYPDQGSSSPIVPSSYSYISSTLPHSSISNDVPSLFPAMNPLSSNLPGPDRILPNPASSRSLAMATTAGGPLPDGLPYFSFSYRSSNPWGPENSMPNGVQGMGRSMANSGPTAGQHNTGRMTSSAAHDAGFGYIPISHSPSSAAMVPTAAYSSNESLDSPSDYQASSGSSLGRNLSREGDASSDTTGEVYGYSTSRRRSDGDETHHGTLMTGQQYTQLPHPSHHSSFNPLHQDPEDMRSHLDHTTSSTALNATRVY